MDHYSERTPCGHRVTVFGTALFDVINSHGQLTWFSVSIRTHNENRQKDLPQRSKIHTSAVSESERCKAVRS